MIIPANVSVVIPTHNRAHTVVAAIDSALSQTYPACEVIVVDDCSTDGTSSLLSSGSRPIRYIRSDVNRRGGWARNTGVDSANGNFIAFLDSDDVWLPGKLERQVELLSRQADPLNTVTYCSTKMTWKDRAEVAPIRMLREGESVADYLFLHGGHLQTSTLMAPRSLLQRIPFRPELPKHQDWDLCLRLERAGVRFAGLDEPLVIWSQDADQNRVSKKSLHHFSRAWIEEYAGSITTRARAAFLLEIVADACATGTLAERAFAMYAAITALRLGVKPRKAFRTIGKAVLR